ncbi:Conserved hypothetical protein [Shewanella piezotolerans WP3]|uniref:Periplasmic protein n=1 Tax=Shewanella piezotolerans (strain WP3 / JCM 13877) TaxID=225849 RepID=B8CHZ9_SHEPW|nr:hypothetical protein [Shewanella piezotolerans]ACJ27275.1 Conserved hypothetical protein [Shewanella piezotolerans WP3]
MIKPQLLLITTASILLSTFAHASIESQLSKCATVQDKLDRLICYDNLANSLAAQNTNGQTPAAETVVVASSTAVVTTTANTQKSAVEEFGNLKKNTEEETVDTIYLTVSKIKKDPYGALKIEFKNGQVWKQADTRHFKLKPEQEIFIKKAALGSFTLGVEDRNTTIRVKRLK